MVKFPHKCPVCGKYDFREPFAECPICGWINDVFQEERPDSNGVGTTNIVSLNEAKAMWALGKKLD